MEFLSTATLFLERNLGYRVFAKLVPILVGSCGGENIDDVGNSIYIIEEAWQADRGTLNYQKVFTPRNEKVCEMKFKYSLSALDTALCTLFPKAKIASSNFLNCSPYLTNGLWARNLNETMLYDMETCGFYNICKNMRIPYYYSLRFVTDVVLDCEPFQFLCQLVQLTHWTTVKKKLDGLRNKLKIEWNFAHASVKPEIPDGDAEWALGELLVRVRKAIRVCLREQSYFSKLYDHCKAYGKGHSIGNAVHQNEHVEGVNLCKHRDLTNPLLEAFHLSQKKAITDLAMLMITNPKSKECLEMAIQSHWASTKLN